MQGVDDVINPAPVFPKEKIMLVNSFQIFYTDKKSLSESVTRLKTI